MSRNGAPRRRPPTRTRTRPACSTTNRRRRSPGGEVTNTGARKRPIRLSPTLRLCALAAGVSEVVFAVGVAAGPAALPLLPDPQAATSIAVAAAMTPARLTGVRMADGRNRLAQRRRGDRDGEGAAPDQHRVEAPCVGAALDRVALV